MPNAQSRAYQKLKQSEFKLRALLDITNAINENYSKAKLFELFEFILRNQLGIGSVILFSKIHDKWTYALKYGTKGAEKSFDIDQDLMHIKSITSIESSAKEHLSQFEVVLPVYHKQEPLAFLLLGKIDGEESSSASNSIIKHLTFLQAMANIISVAIENKRLANESIEQERVNKELELASQMQNMLFPDNAELPDNDEIEVGAYYMPHQQVGGDYYDFFKIRAHEYAFCLADVSGKGMPAALLMSNFQAHLRSILEFTPGLTECIRELNKRVMHSAKGEKFITLFVAIYNSKNRTLNYVNAAHNPPLLKTKTDIYTLNTGCTGLGMFNAIPELKEGLIDIPKDSVLFCYTDGVTEVENNAEEQFEIENLQQFINDNGNLKMQRLNNELIKTLVEFKEDQDFVDDVALLACRFK
jgi:sigma-B regulation protein RsbU (phosphoserine phosphatase)